MKKSNRKAIARLALAIPGLLVATVAAHAQTAAELLPQKYRDAGVINVVTDANFPPYQYIDESGKMVGFEVDLWNAIGEKLGVTMNVTSVAFDSMIPGVQSGRWDISMEAITDNADRQAVVSFVDYGYATTTAYVLESRGEGIDDHLALCGLNGAAQSGTEWPAMVSTELTEACTAAGKPAPILSEYGTNDAALLAVYSGRADFVLTSGAAAQEIKKAAPNPVKVVPISILPRKPSGIVFRKDEVDFGNALLAALKEVRADGTYDKIYAAWDVDALKMDHEPGINLETVNAAQQ